MVTCAVSEIETGVLVFFLALRTEEEMLFSVSMRTPRM
jgi:hypothetical protein